MVSRRVVFALTSPTKVHARTFTKTKAEKRIKKEKAKKGPNLNPDSQPQKHLMKRIWPGLGIRRLVASHWTDDSWTPDAGVVFCTKAHTAWMVATPLNLANRPTPVVLDLGCTRSTRSRAAIERFKKHAWYYGVTTEFCRCPTRRQKPAWRVAVSSFQQHHHVLPRLMCLNEGDVPILFSLSQMKNLGMTVVLDPKGHTITCPAFEYSTMGHIVLDLTNLAYQPTTKSSEQPGHPKIRVTFAMPERKKQHIQVMHQTCMKSKMRMINHMFRPASRKELANERRDLDIDDEDLVPLVPPRPPPVPPVRRRKGQQFGKTQLPH